MNSMFWMALDAGGGFFSSLKKLWNAFYDTYLTDRTYENLSLGSGSLISVRTIVIGIFLGIALALLVSVYHKRFLGALVRKLTCEGICSAELAKSLPELGVADRLLLRSAVKRSVSLRRVVRCREEEEFYRAQEEAKLAHEEKRKTDRSLKKFRYSDFRVDPDAHHFYVPEELKYTAEIKFDSKGTSTGMLIFLLTSSI